MKKVFLCLILVGMFSLGACGSDSSSQSDNNSSNTDTEQKESKSTSSLLKDNKDFKSLAINNGADEAKISAQKDYATSWSDSSWSGVNIAIDKVSVVELENYKDYSDNEYPGFVIVHYVIDNSEKDINIYPEQALMSTNTGEQSEGKIDMKGFAGEVMRGTKSGGYAAYPLSNIDGVDSITQIRLKFHADYSTDDYNDENAHHEYDATVDLK
ncbi:hypothetical protein JZO81_15405 [Enterococcus hulanensis]|uniref:hypothetical protein n=1 Tax=Enterococcus TaxID=1350 RepID=UPI000B73827D|nr:MULTISPECIES: hypothetical protein [Enterococcus]MBO0412456.1 hypothetical protein [Enterococcus hulanensis]OTO15160.1 hypothetical protein A5875_004317 [Enterococcus sp. 3H8_DIV0648]